MVEFLIFLAIYLIATYLFFKVYKDWITDYGTTPSNFKKDFVCFIAATTTMPLVIQMVSYGLSLFLFILQSFM